jgi:excisionase family DNA binding protein
MLTVPEIAARVGRDPETIRRWIRTGKLRARKVGRLRRRAASLVEIVGPTEP